MKYDDCTALNVSSDFNCTCTAVGADDLHPAWSNADTESDTKCYRNTERPGFFNFISDATIRPTVNSDEISCALEGFVNTDSQANRTSAKYNFGKKTIAFIHMI